MPTIDRVRGMLDHLPVDAAHLQATADALLAHFSAYGYRLVDVPLVETAELFLRKSGADAIARMYGFTDQGGRRVALRPEFTAPILRAFLQQPHTPPLPARLAYRGPVFRYEKPQRGRYRQFTQVGVELLGAEPPFADAELLLMTAELPVALGVGPARLVIGHLGVVLAFLEALEVDGRTQAVLLQSLETLKKGREGAAVMRRLLTDGDDGGAPDGPGPLPAGPPVDPAVQSILAGLPRDGAIRLVRTLLGSINTDVGGGRDPEEIVDRLLDRLRGGDRRAKAERAIDVILELSRLAGGRDDALRQAQALLGRYALPLAPLRELEGICVALDGTSFDWSGVTVDLSLGRGLQYYTGLVFELYGSGLGAEGQLCGGGRYDGLAQALGSPTPLPAVGCGWGLERLALLRPAPPLPGPDAVVVPAGECFAYAAEVAALLRRRRLRVELEVRRRALRASVAQAARQGARWLLVVGEREQSERRVTARALASGVEQSLSLDSLAERGLPPEPPP